MLYRKDIDGLRAIAIIAVIIYHAKIEISGKVILTGGFLGVDIFFVISGYLITSILYTKILRNEFDFYNFYLKRIKRLIPASVFLLLVTLPCAFFILPPKETINHAKSILSTIFISSNFWFYFDSNYWAQENDLKPLLHTWSLSIEEQFYIIFPITFIILLKYFKKNFIVHLITVSLFSFIFSVYGSNNYSEFSFFLLPSRIWEFGIGIIFAILYKNRNKELNIHPFLLNIIFFLSILVIFLSFKFFDSKTIHPGFLTLFPVLSTGFLLYFGNQKNLFTYFLSLKPLQYIGLLSYSLYLWHQPVFAFYRAFELPSNKSKIILILISFIFAIISYWVVEKPFRYTKSRLRLFIGVLAPTLVLILISFYTIFSNGWSFRFNDKQLNFLSMNREYGGDFTKYVTFDFNKNIRDINFPTNSKKPNLLIIGDSFAQDFYNILNFTGLKETINISGTLIPAKCKNILHNDPDLDKIVSPKDRRDCEKVTRIGHPLIENKIMEADFIVLASSWDNKTLKKIPSLLTYLNEKGKSKILVVSTKRFKKITTAKIISISFDELKSLKLPPKESYISIHKKMLSLKELNKTNFLNIFDLICTSDYKCPIATNSGVLISHDGGHLTPDGAEFIANHLLKSYTFQNFFKI